MDDMRLEEITKRAKAMRVEDALVFISYMSDELILGEIGKRMIERANKLEGIGGIVNGRD